MKLKFKKAQALSQLQTIILALVGIGIVLAVGFLIMAEVKTQIIDTESLHANGTNPDGQLSYAWNGTNDTIDAISDIPTWLPIIVITLIGTVLIGLVAVFRRI